MQTPLGLGNDVRGRALVDVRVTGLAVEGIGRAGPALVHEDDVAVAMDECEDRLHAGVEGGCTHARAAGENEERVEALAGADGGHHRHPQRDLPPARRRGILRHGQTTAGGLHQGEVERLLQLAGRQLQLPGGRRAAGWGGAQYGGGQPEERQGDGAHGSLGLENKVFEAIQTLPLFTRPAPLQY